MSFVGLELIPFVNAGLHEQVRPWSEPWSEPIVDLWRTASGALGSLYYENLPGIIFYMWINIFDFCQYPTWWSFISFLMSDAYRSPVICPFPYLSFRHFRKDLFWYNYWIIWKSQKMNYFDTILNLFTPHLPTFTQFTQFYASFLTQFTTFMSKCFYSSHI